MTVYDRTLNVNLGPKVPATQQLTKATIWRAKLGVRGRE